jgi:hypothetical protein
MSGVSCLLLLALCGCAREPTSARDFVEFNGTRRSIDSFRVERDPSGQRVSFVLSDSGREVGMVQIQLGGKSSTYQIEGAPDGVENAYVCVLYEKKSSPYWGQTCTADSEVLRSLKLV